jgi:hypothetical protein
VRYTYEDCGLSAGSTKTITISSAPAADKSALEIVNNSPHNITKVVLKTDSATVIEDTVTIAKEGGLNTYAVDPGIYTLLLYNSTTELLNKLYTLHEGAARTVTLSLDPAEHKASLKIVNQTSRTIAKVVLKAGTAVPLNTAGTIEPNSEKTYTDIPPGTYTLTIYENASAPVLSVLDESECVLNPGVTKTVTFSAESAPSAERKAKLKIVNESGHSITKIVLKSGASAVLDKALTLQSGAAVTCEEITPGSYKLEVSFSGNVSPNPYVRDCVLDAGVTKTVTLE